jgi:ubiquinone/menaquinone biosynthesis C-methylase UbiE
MTRLKYMEVDRAADPAFCIRFMDAMQSLPDVRTGRALAGAMLRLAPGMQVLELGSGTGDQARVLAERVVPGGKIVGVDYSKTMVSVATRRHAGSSLPVSFEQGDVRALRFADDSFHACWTERMLCHLPDPAAAVTEIARVLRPGGRLLAIDADVPASTITTGDRTVTAAFTAAIAAQTEQPAMGRQLQIYLAQAGFRDVTERRYVCRLPHEIFSTMATAVGPALIEAGTVTTDAWTTWMENQVEAGAEDRFAMAIPFYAVTGVARPLRATTRDA